MALKLRITKAEWDGLDEGFKSLYEDNGADGYTLAVDGIEDTSALKATVNATRRERDELAKQARAWKELGKTPDEIAELVARAAEDEVEFLVLLVGVQEGDGAARGKGSEGDFHSAHPQHFPKEDLAGNWPQGRMLQDELAPHGGSAEIRAAEGPLVTTVLGLSHHGDLLWMRRSKIERSFVLFLR